MVQERERERERAAVTVVLDNVERMLEYTLRDYYYFLLCSRLRLFALCEEFFLRISQVVDKNQMRSVELSPPRR
jgi:hypothetical protein